MTRISTYNQVSGNPHGRNASVNCGVLHRTYSPSIGSAFNAILNNGTAHTLSGDGHKDEFMELEDRAYHCNGANWFAIGHEAHGVNEQPLDDQQVRDLAEVLLSGQSIGIPMTYTDPFSIPPASVHLNDGNYSGWFSHYSVRTDDGSSQHTDLITMEDFNRAVALINTGTIPPPSSGGGPSGPIAGPQPTPFDGMLSEGDTGPEVAHWQAQINAYAGGHLDVDGVFGPLTAEATRAFQGFFGLDQDGIVGPNTQGMMNLIAGDRHPTPSPAATPPFPGTVAQGDSGDAVRQVQQRLADRGWSIDVDGQFGPQTDNVVRQFQQEKGLQVDGIAGPNTWSALWNSPIT